MTNAAIGQLGSVQTDWDKACSAGCVAFTDGKVDTDNPYPYVTAEDIEVANKLRFAWFEGYRYARDLAAQSARRRA